MENIIFMNNSEETPDIYQMNGGLTDTQYKHINRILVSQDGSVYVACNYGENKFLARADAKGGDFEVIG